MKPLVFLSMSMYNQKRPVRFKKVHGGKTPDNTQEYRQQID